MATPRKAPEDKIKTGRPSKYKPEYCEDLITYMANGFSFLAFAGEIGVTFDTLYEWEKVHPEFSEAKKTGLAKNLSHWESLGMKGMWNDKDGPTLNSSVYIFTMKNRHGWRSGGDNTIAVSTDSKNKTQVIISLPDNGRSVSDDEAESNK